MFKKITNGAGWGLFKIISVQLINFTAIANLSRVLDLSDFGIVAFGSLLYIGLIKYIFTYRLQKDLNHLQSFLSD